MLAIRQHEFGDADTLMHEEVADPRPGPGQVRIRVQAAGVHFIDTAIRAGRQGPMPPPPLPMTPGREVAGEVDMVGSDVEDDWIGRRVVAHLGPANGGYAELAVASADALRTLDDGTDPAEAVAMIGTGRTTMAILDLGHLSANDVVLVTAAAGGIGTLLVQAANRVGATVIGLAGGPTKVERVAGNGAIAVDYLRPRWPSTVAERLDGRSPTTAFDGVGGDIGRAVLELLGPGARLVLHGFSSGTPTRLDAMDVMGRSLTVTSAIGPAMFQRNGGIEALERRALHALAAGELRPAIQRFTLSAASDAHRALESRATMGKVVLVPG